MALIKENTEIQLAPDSQKFRYIQAFMEAVKRTVNGKLDISSNVNIAPVTVNFGVANSDIGIAHNLNRVPRGYIVISRSASFVVYDGGTPWTRDRLYLRSNATGQAKIVII